MNKRVVNISLLIVAITIIIIFAEMLILSIYNYNRFSYDEKDKVEVNKYDITYQLESIIIDFYERIGNLSTNNLENIFTSNSKISSEKAGEIIDIYELTKYNYDLEIKTVYCLSEKNNIYKCEYLLEYRSNVMNDGADISYVEEKESIAYQNSIIIKLIDDNKYRVLHSKFDIGGGSVYEK